MSRRAILVAALAVLFGGPLVAAPVPVAPKADDSVSAPAVRLLQERKVQKELKMSADQRIVVLDGIADLEEEFQKKIEELSRQPKAPEDAFDRLDKELKTKTEKLLGDTATKGLSAAQRKRLGQLDLRIRGVAAFGDEKVVRALQLTDKQKKTAADLAERQKNSAAGYFDNPGNEDDAKRKADLFKARKDFLKQMEDALTADQKAAWALLLGDGPTGFAADDLWLKIEEDADLALPGLLGK
ncbi:MAG: hypothetical protein ACKODX_05835 [Gemmata sp.]